MVELVLTGKVWARSGYLDFGEYQSTNTIVVFIESADGLIHAYQCGEGKHNHILFWVMAMDQREGADDILLETLVQGSWEGD
jgi:hypothetical protein